MNQAAATVAEAQVQRQHPRYKLPLEVTIDGREYATADWSVAGLSVMNAHKGLDVGDTVPVELTLPMRGFSVVTNLMAIRRHNPGDLQRCSLEFTDVSVEQTALLRFFIDNYLAGNIAQIDGFVEFTQRDHHAKPRPLQDKSGAPGRLAMLFKRIAGFLLATSICVIAAYFLGTSLFDRLFLVRSASAIVSGDLIEIDMPSDGKLVRYSEDTRLQPGALLAVITDTDGEEIEISSPCGCDVVSRVAETESFLRRNAPVAQLVESGTEPYIFASVPFAKLSDLDGNVSVRIEYLDGTIVKQRSSDLVSRRLVDPENVGGAAKLRLPAGRDLSVDKIGQPVRVSFNTFALPSLKSLKESTTVIGVWLKQTLLGETGSL